MMHGTHDGVALGHAGHEREVFADVDAGTLVLIGRKGPRTLSGALGLRSQVSSWLGPPTRNSRIQLSLFTLIGVRWLRSASDRPTAPALGRRRAGNRGACQAIVERYTFLP